MKVLICFLLLTLGTQSLEIKTNFENSTGNTMFSIYDYEKYNFKSELEFPLDNDFIVISLSEENIFNSKKNPIKISMDWKKTIQNDNGTFKDRDWFGSYEGEPNISSYGDSKFEGTEYIFELIPYSSDLKVKSTYIKYQIGLGYSLKDYYFEIDNLSQKGMIEGDVEGRVIDYKIEYENYYLKNFLELKYKRIGISLMADYSFLIKGKDVDNHILRKRTYYGETKGKGFKLYGEFTYQIKGTTLNFGYSREKIKNTGYQDQYDKERILIFRNISLEHLLVNDRFWIGVSYSF